MYVWLNGNPRLAQVARVRPQDHHLLPLEVGAEHETVEAVVLDVAGPHPLERVAEAAVLLRRVDLDAALRRSPKSRIQIGSAIPSG